MAGAFVSTFGTSNGLVDDWVLAAGYGRSLDRLRLRNDPSEAAAYVLDGLSDDELSGAFRAATTADRRTVTDLCGLAKGTTPTSSVLRSKMALLSDEDRVLAALALAARYTNRLAQALSAQGGTVTQSDDEDFEAILIDAADQLCADAGAALTRLAAFGTFTSWPLEGYPLSVVVARGEAADQQMSGEPETPNFDELRRLAALLSDIVETNDIRDALQEMNVGRYPTASIVADRDLAAIESIARATSDACGVLNRLAAQCGAHELPDYATIDEIVSLVTDIEAAWPRPSMTVVPVLRAEGALGDAIARLGSAAVDDAEALSAVEAIVSLILAVRTGDDDIIDAAVSLCQAALDACRSWIDEALPTQRLVTAALRGRVEAPDSDSTPVNPRTRAQTRDPHMDDSQALTPVEAGESRQGSESEDVGKETTVVGAPTEVEQLGTVAEHTGSHSPTSDSEEVTEDRRAGLAVDEPPLSALPTRQTGSTVAAEPVSASADREVEDSGDQALGQEAAPSSDQSVDLHGRLRAIESAATEQRRHGLASQAAATAGELYRADAHAALALAEGLRRSTGSLAGELREHLRRISDSGNEVGDRAADSLVLAAALRAAVYSPSLEVSTALAAAREHWTHDPVVCELLDIAIQASRAGINVSAESAALRAAAASDDAVRDAARRAEEELRTSPSKTNKYTAATVVWTTWLRRDGLLGNLLSLAAEDDRSKLDDVISEIARLRSKSTLLGEMRVADSRATKRNEIIAGARDRLLDWAIHSLDVVGEWAEAARAVELSGKGNGSGAGPLVRLRRAATDASSKFAGTLPVDSANQLVAVCAQSALRSLEETVSLILSGTGENTTEFDASEILYGDLLLASGPVLGADGPEREPTADELAVAVRADPNSVEAWVAAYSSRCATGDHEGTSYVIDRISRLSAGVAERWSTTRAADLERERESVKRERRRVADLLASARSHGHLDDAGWSSLSGAIEGLDPATRLDLGHIRDALSNVEQRLSAARADAFERFEERLASALAVDTVPKPVLVRIRERVAADDIATAEEYLALALDGHDLPSPPRPHTEFLSWWPENAEALSAITMDSRVASAVRNGATIGPVDYSSLDAAARLEASAGLEAWTALSAGKPRGRLMDSARPLLALLGMEAGDLTGLPRERSNPEREWRQLTGFRRTGRALVPDFGSQSSGAATGDTLLILMCWGRPRSGSVEAWISQESSSRPVMVWYFGPLDHGDRVALADSLRTARQRRAVVVIDDALIAYVAALGGHDYEKVMRLSLPFAAVNPYQSVGGLTPVEMFYGRDTERLSLRDLTGTALVYGGRQLGKSSLLRATQRDFDDAHNRRALYLDLKANGIGSTRPPEAIWEFLWGNLITVGVLSGEPPASQIRAKLQEAVIRWLDAGAGRALLILFDECDLFLAADADSRFDTVDALDDLMMTAQRRIKFVFAGLHRVQRFKNVENQPLAHLGEPIAVGPLRAHEAMNLVVKPVEALGYEFEQPELPARILAFCNNNPSLIVVFMQALLARMLDTPLRRPGRRRPPVLITDADVEATYAKKSVAELIRERFELTLDLDPAYKVIAYTVAHEARERGEGVELSVRELRILASAWWPVGFDEIGFDGFRALCDELVDLGVLASRHGNYGLRSPNILRFLGSAEQIAEVLIEAENLRPTGTFEATSARPRIAESGTRSPLTSAQLSDALAPRNQVRLVVGAPAGGINRVTEALRFSAGPQVTVDEGLAASMKLGGYRNTGGRHRVLVVDLREVDDTRASHLVIEAVNLRRGGPGTLGIVFTAGTNHLRLWRRAVAGGGDWGRLGVVELGRVDGAAWRYWVEDAELPFGDEASATEALSIVGGLLVPLEEVAGESRRSGKRQALEAVQRRLSDPTSAADILTSVGVKDGPLGEEFASVCEYCADGDELPSLIDAIALAVGDEDLAATDLEILRLIGAVELMGEGRARPLPLLLQARRRLDAHART
ncbi:MAG: hypothetical protein M3256_05660 [Actinomycetota bacterium]|nr:hypothetical protein [Actinomycetota bacterium]